MARIGGMVVGLLALLAGGAAIYAYQQISTLEVAKVTDDVHVIYGLGGNVGVLRTGEGSVVVDTMGFALQGREIRERAEKLAGPVQVVVNTQYYWFHTHGNPGFAPGTKVISTVKTREYLEALDADYWSGAAASTLPNETFEDKYTIHLGGKTVRLMYLGRGHTDGDLVVYFVDDRVVQTGDLFFNGLYPGIDLEAGGSVREWPATIDRILALDFDKVIPGHGPVTDADGLRSFRRLMSQLAAISQEAERSGRSLAETEANAVLDADAGYDVLSIPFVMRFDRDFVIRRAWEEGTGNFKRVKVE